MTDGLQHAFIIVISRFLQRP